MIRAYIDMPRAGGVKSVPHDAQRPANSPGWGMLVAAKGGVYTSRDGERITITAGKTHVSPQFWLVRERPELFQVADKRDQRTTRDHSRALAHVRRELERGGSRTRTTTRTGGVLPPRAAGSALRLPGQASGTRPLRLPR